MSDPKWVVVSTAEFSETFVIGSFDTEEQAVEALNWNLNILEEATKSSGHNYEITRGTLFGEHNVIFEDEDSADGTINLEICEMQPFTKETGDIKVLDPCEITDPTTVEIVKGAFASVRQRR